MKKKDVFVSTIKGIIAGVASLVPGVSTAAVILSVSAYENFIESLHSIAKKDNKLLLFVTLPLIIGLLLGLVGGMQLIDYFWTKYQVQTILLFGGLILGGIRVIFIKQELKFNKKVLLLFVIIDAIFVSLSYLLKGKLILTKTDSWINIVILAIVTGLTLLVPGLSLITHKLKHNYVYMTGLLKNLLVASNAVKILVFVLITVVIIFISAKTIYKLILKSRKNVYIILCSLMFASVLISLLQINRFNFNFVNIFTSLLAFLWGFIFAKNVERE